MIPTPVAIGFVTDNLPPTHIPDWRLFNDETFEVACLRCRKMIDVKAWASGTCQGEPQA